MTGRRPFVLFGIAALAVFVIALIVSTRGFLVSVNPPVAGLSPLPGEVTVSELLAQVTHYDGQLVSFRGEVIGELMRRGQYAWMNVGDPGGVIGVWAPSFLLPDITHVGNYRFWGDIVSVEGIFSAACPEHGGDVDVHAQRLSVYSSGVPRDIAPSVARWIAAGALLLLGVVLTLVSSRTLRDPAKPEP